MSAPGQPEPIPPAQPAPLSQPDQAPPTEQPGPLGQPGSPLGQPVQPLGQPVPQPAQPSAIDATAAYPPVPQYPATGQYPAAGFYPAGQYPYPVSSYPYPMSVAPAGYPMAAPKPSRLPLILLSVAVAVLAIAFVLTGVLFLQQKSETAKSNQAVADAHAAVDRLNAQLASVTADRDAAKSDAESTRAAIAACVQDASDLFGAADESALSTALEKLRTDCRNPG